MEWNGIYVERTTIARISKINRVNNNLFDVSVLLAENRLWLVDLEC